ncbi:MAG: DUF3391 domain-containing protein [Woeseiaceae bacterium]
MDRNFFFIAGGVIEGNEEIEQFQNSCEYVFVDDEKSDAVVAANLQTVSFTSKSVESVSESTIAVQTQKAELEQINFQKELKVAKKIHSKTLSFINTALEDIRLGQAVNTESAKEIVSEIANSITRSPHAMMCMTRLPVTAVITMQFHLTMH